MSLLGSFLFVSAPFLSWVSAPSIFDLSRVCAFWRPPTNFRSHKPHHVSILCLIGLILPFFPWDFMQLCQLEFYWDLFMYYWEPIDIIRRHFIACSLTLPHYSTFGRFYCTSVFEILLKNVELGPIDKISEPNSSSLSIHCSLSLPYQNFQISCSRFFLDLFMYNRDLLIWCRDLFIKYHGSYRDIYIKYQDLFTTY